MRTHTIKRWLAALLAAALTLLPMAALAERQPFPRRLADWLEAVDISGEALSLAGEAAQTPLSLWLQWDDALRLEADLDGKKLLRLQAKGGEALAQLPAMDALFGLRLTDYLPDAAAMRALARVWQALQPTLDVTSAGGVHLSVSTARMNESAILLLDDMMADPDALAALNRLMEAVAPAARRLFTDLPEDTAAWPALLRNALADALYYHNDVLVEVTVDPLTRAVRGGSGCSVFAQIASRYATMSLSATALWRVDGSASAVGELILPTGDVSVEFTLNLSSGGEIDGLLRWWERGAEQRLRLSGLRTSSSLSLNALCETKQDGATATLSMGWPTPGARTDTFFLNAGWRFGEDQEGTLRAGADEAGGTLRLRTVEGEMSTQLDVDLRADAPSFFGAPSGDGQPWLYAAYRRCDNAYLPYDEEGYNRGTPRMSLTITPGRVTAVWSDVVYRLSGEDDGDGYQLALDYDDNYFHTKGELARLKLSLDDAEEIADAQPPTDDAEPAPAPALNLALTVNGEMAFNGALTRQPQRALDPVEAVDVDWITPQRLQAIFLDLFLTGSFEPALMIEEAAVEEADEAVETVEEAADAVEEAADAVEEAADAVEEPAEEAVEEAADAVEEAAETVLPAD